MKLFKKTALASVLIISFFSFSLAQAEGFEPKDMTFKIELTDPFKEPDGSKMTSKERAEYFKKYSEEFLTKIEKVVDEDTFNDIFDKFFQTMISLENAAYKESLVSTK